MFSFVVWVRAIADVKPRPAIKPTRTHTADVVGREILADFVPLVRAHPKLIAAGAKRDPDRVANSPRKDFSIRAIGIELEDERDRLPPRCRKHSSANRWRRTSFCRPMKRRCRESNVRRCAGALRHRKGAHPKLRLGHVL